VDSNTITASAGTGNPRSTAPRTAGGRAQGGTRVGCLVAGFVTLVDSGVAGGPAGDAAVRDGALGLARTALDHLVDPDQRQAVHDDFAAQGGPLEVEGYFG